MIETLLRKLRPWPIHPIDRLYGIETSKRVRWLLFGGATTSPEQRAACLGYAGSQPSVIRKAIEVIPEIAGAHFIDLGCGKGRVVAVATEFPFASIGGVEISPRLVRRARANMKRLARSNPERVSPTITQGDASRPDLPYFPKAKGERMAPAVLRSVRRLGSGSGLPWYLSRSGLGSKVST